MISRFAGTWRWSLPRDYDLVGFNAVDTPYRQHVRQVIPNAVQEQIRGHCNDRNVIREGAEFLVAIPASCSLKIDPAQAAEAAAIFRAHPQLVNELNWHLAAVASYMTNIDALEEQFRILDKSIYRHS